MTLYRVVHSLVQKITKTTKSFFEVI